MTKKLLFGLFLSILIFGYSLFFLLKTEASDFQGKDIEDVVMVNFNAGGEINVISPSGKTIGANYSKEYDATVSMDKGKGEIYFEKRGYTCIVKTSKVKLLYVSPSGTVDIYM